MQSLKDLLPPITPQKPTTNPTITSIEFDSREVLPNSLFFALKGQHTDGHKYINQAIAAGACAIIHSDPIDQLHKGIVYVQVPDTRRALSTVSAIFHDHPSKELTVIGVTGTDGKSTTVSLIQQLLEHSDIPAGKLSTVEFSTGKTTQPNPLRQSTPEAPQIQSLLRQIADAGQKYAVLEATSHGLSKINSRLEDVDFDVAVFTNLSQEHLEFHKTMENYRNDKARLFEKIAISKNKESFGVINHDDMESEFFMDSLGEKPFFTYSLLNKDSDIYADNIQSDIHKSTFTLHTPWGEGQTSIRLPGRFNIENLLASLCTVSELLQINPLEFETICPKLKGIKGRMEPVETGRDFHVMVDYAHSPGSFSQLLPFIRKITKGRIIIVFGSAGERDLEKRPVQGDIASQYGDIIILTDEDPRGEDSMKIIKDIAKGVKNKEPGKTLFQIPDRREAIKKAMRLAQKDDLVLTLGKGHEKSIIYSDGPAEWDEAKVCKELLIELNSGTA